MTARELTEARHALGLSEARLAEALGVARSTVSRWERGERKIPPFLALAFAELARRYSRASAG